MEKFPPKESEFTKTTTIPAPWRHELDHEIESVFWLMLYWAMTAQPKGGATEYIANSSWSLLTGSVAARQSLLNILRTGPTVEETFHSTFQPLNDLFLPLAEILCSIDRHWVPASEKPYGPEYFAEAFQRLILQFLIDHKDDDDKSFMNQAIGSNPRELEQQGTHPYLALVQVTRDHMPQARVTNRHQARLDNPNLNGVVPPKNLRYVIDPPFLISFSVG
ncbi:hypothetical protein FRC00_003365 [Tulasnella sp. 408]|nr:hypothetical protein FRC00_003365 [Tulasnella sp. 408]